VALAIRPATFDDIPALEALIAAIPTGLDAASVVWDACVAGRLHRRGVLDAARLEAGRRAFARAFPMLGEESAAAWDRFFTGAAATHRDIVAFVLEPRGGREGAGLRPGERCPVCRFPTHAPEPEGPGLPAAVVDAIRADFPSWQPAAGLCRHCADLYRARCVSRRQADASSP
jgi:hypothetical protein